MEYLQEAVVDPLENKTKLHIVGNNSKAFLNQADYSDINTISLQDHAGIVDYQPDELFVTVKAGTKLSEINSTLKAKNQFLAFMPPDYTNSTIGGTTACALAGSSKPYLGAVRDHILGLKLINGKAKHLTFGGQMIKNVAGFDVSRLLCGSKGKFGIITELSFKTLPRPAEDITLKLEKSEADSISQMNELGLTNFPIIAAAFIDGFVYYRLAGFKAAISKAKDTIGGELAEQDVWDKLNPFKVNLNENEYLWRITCAIDNPIIPNTVAIDWGGARRWVVTKDKQDP
jgi:glycolate oxidase FAD binding subunit